MRKSNYIFVFIISLLVTACEKPEKLWELPPAGDEKVASVNMGSDYEKVVFFTLHNEALEIHDLNSWHIAFASGTNDHHILLNGGNEVQVYETNDTSFAKNYPVGFNSAWKWDNPSGNKDSTAFASWYNLTANESNSNVYILDLGKNAPVRYKKIKILEVDPLSYTIQYANTDCSDFHKVTISKNSKANFTYFNFTTHQSVDFEPSTEWHLQFARYRHIYYDMTPITPYHVAGVLINTKLLKVAETKTISFENINSVNAQELTFSDRMDEIGFDWKFYDLKGSEKYIVDDKKVFVLKTSDGLLYKLKMIDFYDCHGNKGAPKFVYQRL